MQNPGIVPAVLDLHFRKLFQGKMKPLAPLDDGHTVLAKKIIQADRAHILFSLEPVQVHMIDGAGALIQVHEGERRAADRIRIPDPEAPRDAACQRRLSGAQRSP